MDAAAAAARTALGGTIAGSSFAVLDYLLFPLFHLPEASCRA